jgi:hypothetical protein
VPLGTPLYSPSRCTVSGSRPSNQLSTAKGASWDQLGNPSIPTTCLEQLRDSGHAVKAESRRTLITSQVPAPLSTKCAAHSVHIFPRDLRESNSPRPTSCHQGPGSMGTKCRGLSSARSTSHGLTSHLSDEVGRRGTAHHNSSRRHDSLGTINDRLRETSEGEARLETTSPTSKEAP